MTQIFLGDPSERIKEWIKTHSPQDKPKMTPLCFEALEDERSSIALGYWDESNSREIDIPDSVSFVYSKDDQTTWSDYVGQVIDLNKSEKVYFRAKTMNNNLYVDGYKFAFFKMTGGKVAASGNINTLLNPDPEAEVSLEGKEYCFSYLFSRYAIDENWGYIPCCQNLVSAPALPAETLADGCYAGMFSNCSSLTQAPALPAETLADGCYSSMFSYCSSLTQAPALPAETLADGCYAGMFFTCESLTQAPALPAETLADGCYYYMFSDCTNINSVVMKKSVEGVYNPSTHGMLKYDKTITINYILD